jgi:hypothetical protein
MHRVYDQYGPQPYRDCSVECVADIDLHVHVVWTASILSEDDPDCQERIASLRAVIKMLNPEIEVLELTPLDPWAVTPYQDTPDRYRQPWRFITIPKEHSAGLTAGGVVS